MQHKVMEPSGVHAAFWKGMDVVRRGWRYLIIGQFSEAEQSIIPGLFMLKHLSVIGNGSADINHYCKAIRFILYKRDRYSFGDIVTNHYRPDQDNEVIQNKAAEKEIKPAFVRSVR